MRKTKPIMPTLEEDAEIQRGIDADPDNPEWTTTDFKRARPAREALSSEFLANGKKGPHTIIEESDAQWHARTRGKQKAPTKELISIRLSAEVLARFRNSGAGWQGRIDGALKDWLKRHSPRKPSRSPRP